MEVASATWSVWGLFASVLVSDRSALAGSREVVEAELGRVDAACSRFRDDSELAGLNRRAGRYVDVSALFLDELDAALWAADVTDGALDPTVGYALECCGYDRDFDRIGPEATAPVVRAAWTGAAAWRRVRIDRVRRAVRLPVGCRLDLGATAKARTADRAAALAYEATGAGVLVNLGGDIATAGPPPRGGWLVGVSDSHTVGLDAAAETVVLTGGGLATSSTTRRRWRLAGREMHHIIDPATGRPARSAWRTVSVAAATCLGANTASTAAVVRGAPAENWLSALGLPARLVAVDGRVRRVAGWGSAACR